MYAFQQWILLFTFQAKELLHFFSILKESFLDVQSASF